MRGRNLTDRFIRRIVSSDDGYLCECSCSGRSVKNPAAFVIGGRACNGEWKGWTACHEHAQEFARTFRIKMPYYERASTK